MYKRQGKYFINRTSSLLFLLHLVFFAVLSMDLAGNLTAPEVAALFPYDYVCMAYEEDEELFQKIEEELSLIHIYKRGLYRRSW